MYCRCKGYLAPKTTPGPPPNFFVFPREVMFHRVATDGMALGWPDWIKDHLHTAEMAGTVSTFSMPSLVLFPAGSGYRVALQRMGDTQELLPTWQWLYRRYWTTLVCRANGTFKEAGCHAFGVNGCCIPCTLLTCNTACPAHGLVQNLRKRNVPSSGKRPSWPAMVLVLLFT